MKFHMYEIIDVFRQFFMNEVIYIRYAIFLSFFVNEVICIKTVTFGPSQICTVNIFKPTHPNHTQK